MINLFSSKYDVENCLANIRECLEKGWTGVGEKTKEFEKVWGEYVGFEHNIYLSTATAGFFHTLVCLKELNGWQDQDEIITSPITFVSANHSILHAGLKPVFADVDDTLCLDPESVREKITDKTRAVIFVGMGGNAGELEKVAAICQKAGVYFILDAAHMSGTKLNGRVVGNQADIAIYSFQYTKVLATAESGMVCCRDERLLNSIQRKAWCGIDKSRTPWSEVNKDRWYFDVNEIGDSSLGNDIMASIALAQFSHLEEEIKIRNRIAEKYWEGLKYIEKIGFIRIPDGCCSSRWLFQIVVENRDALIRYLEERQIYAGIHYLDNTLFKPYRYARGTCPKAQYYSERVVSLPLHLKLSEADIQFVIDTVAEFMETQ